MSVIPLSHATDASVGGGKAYGLACLIAHGAPVPEGLVLTREAFERFLAIDDLGGRIAAAASGVDSADVAALESVSNEIRAWIHAAPLPEDLKRTIGIAASSLGEGAIAVRSSAWGEDSAKASFAGQLDTVLNVRGEDAAERAVKECWASYWSARALAYQRRRGTSLRGMGVILQRQVDARVSGVLFTRAPDSREKDAQMLGEYVYGLGEALVSGRADPGRFLLDREARCVTRAAPPEAHPEAEAVLSSEHLEKLGRMAAVLEQRLGAPQDIEWTIDGRGELYLVQSRPITTGRGAAPAPTHLPSRCVVWSNANINENFPEPVTPFLFSIASEGYSRYFRNLAVALGVSEDRLARMEPYLSQVIGAHGGRLYYNQSNLHAILRLAPFGERLAAYFDQFVGADPEKPEHLPEVQRGRVMEAVEGARFVARLFATFVDLDARIREFEQAADDFARTTHPTVLAQKSLTALRDDLRAFCEIRFHRWTNAALADAAAMISYGVLKQFLRRLCPAPEQAALPDSLLKGLTDLASSAPVHSLWKLSRRIRQDRALRQLFETSSGDALLAELRSGRFAEFASALGDHLEGHGFRGSGELMLSVPSFQEDPRGLLQILAGYVRLDGTSPAERLRAQAVERLEATRKLRADLAARARIPGIGALVSLVLAWTRRAVGYRERARTKQALLYSRLRRVMLAIGDGLVSRGTLAAREDVFFLSHLELDPLLSGGALLPNVRGLIDVRRAEHATQSSLAPPDRMILEEGVSYSEANAFGVRLTLEALPAVTDRGSATSVLYGMPTCGGKVTGRAAALTSLTEAASLQPGDILVTRQTDPGWAPVFFLIGGLVMERGGMLSHGSILAREFGLPSVAGVKEATSRVMTGSEVTVDGDLGEVRLHG
jgi:rifampicin phosphotransferase